MLQRRLLDVVLDRLQAMPAVVLLGPSQVGKTTLARDVAARLGEQALYLDLEREADRLSALFEAARAEARASGLPLLWVPAQSRTPESGSEGAPGFRFVGLPAAAGLPQHWLTPGVEAEVIGAKALVLGPEPIIGAQRVALRLADRRLTLVTDGMGPFKPDHADLNGAAATTPGTRP